MGEKLSIKRLVGLGFSTIGLVVSAMVATVVYQLIQIKDLTGELEQVADAKQAALNAKFHTVQIQQFITDASLTGDEEGVKESKKHLEEMKKSLTEIEKDFPEKKSLLSNIASVGEDLFSVGEEMYAAYLNKGKEAGNLIMKREGTGLDARSQVSAQKIDELVSAMIQLEKESASVLEKAEIRLQLILYFLAVVSAIVMVGAYIFLKSKLTQITRLLAEIAKSGEQVASAGSEIADAAYVLSNSATEAAASIETTTASTEEISSIVKGNARGALQARELSQEAEKKAQTGHGEVKKLIESMLQISAGSRKIEEIISVIDDIAFQTNLLALNAAVEAARAGEQGKGFAVVADAVRTLAQRSSNSAKEINDLIKDSVRMIEQGSSVAQSSGAALVEIVSAVEKVTTLNTEISDGSQEQSQGIEHINKAINDLDRVTQSNAASAEQCAASAKELSEQSYQVKEKLQTLNYLLGA